MRIGMQMFDSLAAAAAGTPTVVTIGNFDGVHRGHQRILQRARDIAAEGRARVVVVTFEPHPAALLAPDRAPVRLTTAAERAALLAAHGADACVTLATTHELLAQTADEFLERLARALRPVAIVEGPDFNFGRGRTGSNATLQARAGDLGFAAHVVTPARTQADGQVSSTAIRALLRAGDVSGAAALLGRAHRISGWVQRGDGRGAALGFPTANLDGIMQMLPAEGVYAAVGQLADGTARRAAVNIGPQPTFDQPLLRVEAFLLGHEGALHGQAVGLHLLRRIRATQKFENVAALVAQLGRDADSAREERADEPPVLMIPL